MQPTNPLVMIEADGPLSVRCLSCGELIYGTTYPVTSIDLRRVLELLGTHTANAHPAAHEISALGDAQRTFLRADGTTYTEPWEDGSTSLFVQSPPGDPVCKVLLERSGTWARHTAAPAGSCECLTRVDCTQVR